VGGNRLNFIARVREERWRRLRIKEVIESLRSEVSPLFSRPYIEGGRYHWKDGNDTSAEVIVDLDFVWPDYPLAVKVAPRINTAYDKSYSVSRKFWEEVVELEAHTVDVCRRCNMPLLAIGPNDPITPYALLERVRTIRKVFENEQEA
jgi:hypothetical protein